jgi:phosphoribosylanthranilate isomerase
VLVKICGITSEADALLAVALGADAVGFIFAPSPRQVTPQVVDRIINRLPREILTVGVFRDESPKRVVEITNGIGLRAAQLHGSETSADSQYVAERVPVTIKAFPAGHRDVARSDEFGAQAVLIDGASPGSGEVFEWRLAEGVVDPSRLILSGGLNANNVGDAIAHLHPFGVDASSGVESSPGQKDPRKMREFIAAVRGVSGEDGGSPNTSLTSVMAGGSRADSSSFGQDADPAEDAPYDWRND